MKKEILSQFGHGDLILFGFLLFFVCFLGVLFWTCRKSQKSHFDKLASIPLYRSTHSATHSTTHPSSHQPLQQGSSLEERHG